MVLRGLISGPWPILDRLVDKPLMSKKMYPLKVTYERNWNLGGTKLSLGQLFPFLDLQDCLASLRSADNCPVDLGK